MDEFLNQFREEPRPEFAQDLYARLQTQKASTTSRGVWKWSPLLAAASLAVVMVLALNVPTVRAIAQNFLDLFRVKKFAAVSIDIDRLKQLKEANLDFRSLLTSDGSVSARPTPPQHVATPEAAAQLAGIQVRTPKLDQFGLTLRDVAVQPGQSNTFTADSGKLQALLEALEINDLEVPAQLNGAQVTMNFPTSVMMTYGREERSLMFVQSPSPHVSLPAGVQLSQLGEIALRVAGMSPSEARTFAQSIDWHNTLLVPVPSQSATFREVTVHGTSGILITSINPEKPKQQVENHRRKGAMLLWSENGMVYAMSGDTVSVDLIEMANTIN
ncbi:MAG: hypothetical protein HY774_26960 [Acidobacteria bacterium]|nr:hypothetical protein [Acidobacteriota bacterium]